MTQDTYLLPSVFYTDHRMRDLPEEGESVEVGMSGKRVKVRMDEEAFRDLYSDALYYSDSGIAADMGLPSLARSAERTLAALRKQNPELVETIEAEREARGWS